ncbi:MAG: VCBS repeat-containing protein [Deltaproteobacteria bacterium]|nr:VCBS repeat-containing protein [Deltaproteobacteria bacterium]
MSGGIGGSDDNGVVCTDVDDDGDFDAVVIALGSPERFYENDGSGNFTFVGGVFPGPTDCSLWGEFGDLNGDGRIDLVTGQGECSSSDEVYFANDGVPVDSTNPVIRSVEAPPAAVSADTEVVVRYAVSDRTVTDEGPRLARAYAVVDPSGAATEIDATAMGGDLFRVTIPAQPTGTVVYTLCAEDPSGNVGCSTEQMYDVGEGGTTTGGSDSGGVDTTASTDPTDPDSSGGASASASASASNTGTASDSATASAGDSDGSGSSSSDTAGGTDSSGCSCDAAQRGTPTWFGLALLGVAAVRRRRRR